MDASDRSEDGIDPPSDGHDDHDRETGVQDEPSNSASIEGRSVVQLSVPDMDCPSCAGKVERSVRKLDGIETSTRK